MRVLFALPGLHRYDRGAEVAFVSLATELARAGDDVTLIGSGDARPGTSYRFLSGHAIARERFEALPSLPLLRGDTSYEELTFIPSLLRRYRPANYDVTITCSYPFTNWALRKMGSKRSRPAHIFVTQNGDWAAYSRGSEYRLFGCDGLVFTNPDYYARNQARWRCALIPNGIDTARFAPGMAEREALGLPADAVVVLMVSALIPSKRVADGIEAVSRIEGAHLLVAGDGPLRNAIADQANRLLPGRFSRVSVPASQMPALYRSADVFLHLSKIESFGNVYLEALACGLPVVAHESENSRWILGDTSFLTDTENIGAVAQAIRAAVSSPEDAAQTRRRRAEEFAWANVAAQYRAFFDVVVAAAERKQPVSSK